MKKTLLILFVAVISLTACKKESAKKLNGRWDGVKDYYVETVDGIKTYEENNTYKLGDNYIVFDGNKFQTYDEGMLEDEGTFTTTDNSITFSDKGGTVQTMSLRWNSSNEVVFSKESSETSNGKKYTTKNETTLKRN